MLGHEGEPIALAPEVEQGIGPGMELTGASERLAGAYVVGALPRVMHDEYGELVLALELAEVVKQRRHRTGDVLVATVHPHEGVEHQNAFVLIAEALRSQLV